MTEEDELDCWFCIVGRAVRDFANFRVEASVSEIVGDLTEIDATGCIRRPLQPSDALG
jgi:hypothetical protein